ncbi:MAG: ATP-binding protein [Pseudomonadota bacterium]|nr:ATP-binding protein [Pseudomonadota bacterium]
MVPKNVLLTLVLPLGVAAYLLGLATLAPEDLPHSTLRFLAGLAAVGILLSALLTVRALRARDRQIVEAAALLGKVRTGDVHHFLPVPRDDPFGDLAERINEIVGELRTRHVADETDRVLDGAMLQETPNGLLITDAAGRVRRFNPALTRLLPVAVDPIGKAPIEGFPVHELQEVIDETRRTRQPSERVATVGRKEVLVRGIPLADGAGCMGVVLDITSIRAAERARRDFVANVSHELRTPVTALVGYAESLLDDRAEFPPWAQPMLEAMNRNARRLAALIEDVLQLSKIEARQGDLPLAAESLRPVVREVLARFADRARQKDIALTLVDGPDVEARISGEAFEHALGNLVDNALKYTNAGGRIDVSVVVRATGVYVAVKDDGIGVDALHHERIFERFYRVDAGRSRDVGGTGLGLALVKHLCLAMQAEVALESALGAGTTFTLRLPR